MPRAFSSLAIERTLVIPWDLMLSTMVRRFNARCCAFVSMTATPCWLSTCLPLGTFAPVSRQGR